MSRQATGAISASEIKQGLKEDVDQIRDDLNRLGRDVGGTARDIAGAAKQGAREARHYVEESVDAVKERAMEQCDHTRDMIKKNPLTSVAVAFGSGILLGVLLRRM